MIRCRACASKAIKRGLCNRHYLRWYRYGNVTIRKSRANGEGSVSTQGYRLITVDGRQMLEHRYVMALHLGRRLRRAEIVHHIDGNKLNNVLTNLQLVDRRTHMRLHPDHVQFWQTKGSPARWKKGTT